MANQTDSGGGSFLGGGPKFNQAGDNKPMAGEKVADVAVKPTFFGGPRIWIGALVVIVLLAVLWIMFGNGIIGTQQKGGRAPLSSAPQNINPDAPSGGQ